MLYYIMISYRTMPCYIMLCCIITYCYYLNLFQYNKAKLDQNYRNVVYLLSTPMLSIIVSLFHLATSFAESNASPQLRQGVQCFSCKCTTKLICMKCYTSKEANICFIRLNEAALVCGFTKTTCIVQNMLHSPAAVNVYYIVEYSIYRIGLLESFHAFMS